MLMDKYPIIIYIGAAILGKVGGEMMITDPFVEGIITPDKFIQYGVEALCAAGVIVAGKLLMKWKIARGEKQAHIHNA
jgi:predicted tellurium resistance membrane protein TerC